MKRHAPATSRNRDPIGAVLRRILPTRGTVLEVAAGTGEHAAFFAASFPHLTWQPTDLAASARESIEARRREAGLENLLPPLALDAAAASWPVTRADGVVCINMIHIAAWESCLGLLAGARRVLPAGAPLYLYGPFFEAERAPAPSNIVFDESLRASDPRWGVRWRHEVEAAARREGLELDERVEMPANNLSLIFRRAPGGCE